MKEETKIKPIGNRVLVDTIDVNETESGWILSSENKSMTPMRGIITALGDTVDYERFEKGDIIYFRKYSVDELKYMAPEGEKTHYLVEVDEILAKE